jgi:hypothetical protein
MAMGTILSQEAPLIAKNAFWQAVAQKLKVKSFGDASKINVPIGTKTPEGLVFEPQAICCPRGPST